MDLSLESQPELRELERRGEELDQNPLQEVVGDNEEMANSPSYKNPKGGQTNLKTEADLEEEKFNRSYEGKEGIGGQSSPKSGGARLKTAEKTKKRDKQLAFENESDNLSPKNALQHKTEKCVKKEKISREKVTKLKKKFERLSENSKMHGKAFGRFKKNQNEGENRQGEGKSAEGGDQSGETSVGGPDEKPDDMATMSAGGMYPNNYRKDGTRAREAELNREKKLMENKGLLSKLDLDEEPEMKGDLQGELMNNMAFKKVPKLLMRRARSDDIPKLVSTYPVLVSTTFTIFFVFLAELVFNKISFNGRCISKVVYPETSLNKKPYQIIFGYGACEYNLQENADNRSFMGYGANDRGWPTNLVSDDAALESSSSYDTPNYRVFSLFGGMESNMIRNYGENFRIFWSMFMHTGLVHLLFNVFSQSQILWIIEPDWGFVRTMGAFIVSGLVGNLAAGAFDPSFTVVGSSGCMFGLIASLIPYCIENWTLLTSPLYIFIFVVVITILSLSLFSGSVSLYCHFGGWIAGLLWGFGTLRNSFHLNECGIKESFMLSFLFRNRLTPELKTKLKQSFQTKRRKCISKMRMERNKKFKEKVKDLTLYPVTYFKREVWDIVIRVVPLMALFLIIASLCSFMFVESVYSRYFPLSEASKGTQCCYFTTKGEGDYTRKLFWCFENYETAKNFCD